MRGGEAGAERNSRSGGTRWERVLERMLCRDGIRRGAYDLVSLHHALPSRGGQARAEVSEITDAQLLLIGAVLYWAEGYKRIKIRHGGEITAHPLSLTNSDPAIISVFIVFLTKILRVQPADIKIEMRLFKHLDAEKMVCYWMWVTGLPRSQFGRPTYPVSISSQHKRPFNRLPYGTVQVIVSNTQMFYRVMGFIDGVKEQMRLRS